MVFLIKYLAALNKQRKTYILNWQQESKHPPFLSGIQTIMANFSINPNVINCLQSCIPFFRAVINIYIYKIYFYPLVCIFPGQNHQGCLETAKHMIKGRVPQLSEQWRKFEREKKKACTNVKMRIFHSLRVHRKTPGMSLLLSLNSGILCLFRTPPPPCGHSSPLSTAAHRAGADCVKFQKSNLGECVFFFSVLSPKCLHSKARAFTRGGGGG